MIKERVSRRNWRFENEEEVKPSAMRLSLGLNKRQLFLPESYHFADSPGAHRLTRPLSPEFDVSEQDS